MITSARVLASFAASIPACLIASSTSASITFMHQFSSLDASMNGTVGNDPPGDNRTFFSGHDDSILHPPAPDGTGTYFASFPRAIAATQGRASYSGGNASWNTNTSFNYNGEFAPGVPDTSTRTFSLAVAHDVLFELTETNYIWTRLTFQEELGAWGLCTIYGPGAVGGGGFVGPELIDIPSIGTTDVILSPGLYRFRAEFTNSFDRNAGFLMNNQAGFTLSPTNAPTPGSIALLSFAGATAARRRRRAKQV